ncbi:MAG: hypothetical protein Q4Q23_03830 [Methanobacteriaceae archaeon]|nr:hypothetical protein [Methanobacteriaceae archaeon]
MTTSDLIEFGKYLYTTNNDDFAKDVKETDVIFPISFNNSKFELGSLCKKNEITLNYDVNSIFNNELYISTDQRVIIPIKGGLLGLSPFFIKLDNDFINKNGKYKKKEIKNFKNKVKQSLNNNNNNNEFIEHISKIYKDPEKNFLEMIPDLNNEKYIYYKSFFKKYLTEKTKSLIIDYYEFINTNIDSIIEKIIKYKSEQLQLNENPSFYLTCVFNSDFDLINDILVYYSIFSKKRNKKIKDYGESKCPFCTKKCITYPFISCYTATEPTYFFEYKSEIKKSKLKLCKTCNAYLLFAEDKLKKIFLPNIMVIPKLKNNKNDFKEFLKASNTDENTFIKLNEILENNSNKLNYDLVLYEKNSKGDKYDIKKYVENYRAFLATFKTEKKEKILLYNEDHNLIYLFNENYFKQKKDNKLNNINSIFDLEYIFKELFIDVKEEIKYLKLEHFYEIYTKDVKKLMPRFDVKTVTIFIKYMHNIFDFIYELNLDAINRNMINEMFLNILIKLEKNKNHINYYNMHILKRLNYYFMLKKEFLGETMLETPNLEKLKCICRDYSEDKDNDIIKIINNDKTLKYYLIGQFVRLIDDTKHANNKKNEVFSNFISNVNRNNIKNLFVTEILQKNDFYIKHMNEKGKIIFKIFENDLSSVFSEKKNYSYEEYLLLMFTGYYTTNILSSSENKEELI